MLTEEEFRLFRDFIYDESGIYLSENRKDFLENRLQRRMRDMGVSSPYWYYRLISDRSAGERMAFLDILTVNETSFFRNRPQLELFRSVILPDVLGRRAQEHPKRLRIWSAGCSTGEEPYTVAMIIRESLFDLPAWEVCIFASDLSLSALRTASRAEYPEDKVREAVEEPYLSRYFENIGGNMRVKEAIRKMVTFDLHNLKNNAGPDNLDVILCRNVMIYFDANGQTRLIEKFHRALNPGGYLLLGHAESIQGMDTGFRFVYNNKGTAYRKTGKEEK